MKFSQSLNRPREFVVGNSLNGREREGTENVSRSVDFVPGGGVGLEQSGDLGLGEGVGFDELGEQCDGTAGVPERTRQRADELTGGGNREGKLGFLGEARRCPLETRP